MTARYASTRTLPWIEVRPNTPYFVTEAGEDWMPIGQNDAITWPELAGAFRRRDLPSVEQYFAQLQASGVTVLRLMLEYCHTEHRHLERPLGVFQPNMVRLWDDLFALCERYGLRLLLTPYDTFWMWLHWHQHPYNKANGGICADRGQWLLSKEMRQAIKDRYAFAIERWGGSGALFAWDIWNELHPAHGGNTTAHFSDFIADVSEFVRSTELRLYGRGHPRTVSFFGPTLVENPQIAEVVFGHPALDFASTHFYERDTIDCPRDTVAPAISTGRLIREALGEIADLRPFFDSEHGPIHLFKDRRVTLPEPFDDEYFRHMQWAHFASGGAGGGMRWPNRHPHTLTRGMRAAQGALAQFLPLLDWAQFQRRNLNHELRCSHGELALFGCGDAEQAVAWLLRTDTVGTDGRLRHDAEPLRTTLAVPGLMPGTYTVTAWDTERGVVQSTAELQQTEGDELCIPLRPFVTDLAVAVRRAKP
jgi:mannan endo-1,4-beta-mannosidase